MSSVYLTSYRTSYSRALQSYANNGFLARELDADDIAFIENIRERGNVACGSLGWPVPTACTHSDDVIPRVALLEEMDFWQQPYALDRFVHPRHGPIFSKRYRPTGTTPHALERQRRRDEMATAEAEEQRAYEAKQRERIAREIEWEEAAPHRKFGLVVNRHYIPQWKIEDDRQGKLAKLQKDTLENYRYQEIKLARRHAIAERQRIGDAKQREAEAKRREVVLASIVKQRETANNDPPRLSEQTQRPPWFDLELQQRIAELTNRHSGYYFTAEQICGELGLPLGDRDRVLDNCYDACKRGLIKQR